MSKKVNQKASDFVDDNEQDQEKMNEICSFVGVKLGGPPLDQINTKEECVSIFEDKKKSYVLLSSTLVLVDKCRCKEVEYLSALQELYKKFDSDEPKPTTKDKVLNKTLDEFNDETDGSESEPEEKPKIKKSVKKQDNNSESEEKPKVKKPVKKVDKSDEPEEKSKVKKSVKKSDESEGKSKAVETVDPEKPKTAKKTKEESKPKKTKKTTKSDDEKN